MFIDNRKFVQVWMEAKTTNQNQSWVAEKLKTTRQAVSIKAYNLRKKGVNLPKLARPLHSALDVDELNALIENEEQKTL